MIYKHHDFIDKTSKCKHKPKRTTPEYHFHCEVANTLNKILNPNLTCWSSVENSNHTGGISGMIKQRKDKCKGVKSGVPDLFILYNGTSLWIELKAKKGTISDSQDLFHQNIKIAKNNIEVIRSIDELLNILLLYKIPTLIHKNENL